MSLAWLSVIVPVALMAFALGLERLEARLLGPAEPRSDEGQRPGARSARKIRSLVGWPLVAVLVGGLLVGCADTTPRNWPTCCAWVDKHRGTEWCQC